MFQMPQLIDDTDWDFAGAMNQVMLKEVQSHAPVVIIDNPRYCVLEQKQGENRIAMVDKSTGRMVYLVELDFQRSPDGDAVTQVTVWRDPDSILSQGITSTIFNDVLLPRYGRIMSDAEQTRDGQRFWRGRMAEAADRGDRVGLAHMADKCVDWYPPESKDFKGWINKQDAWGREPAYQDLRFIICRASDRSA